MAKPHNAGQKRIINQLLPMPEKDVDLGTITITENWGRLFIKKGAHEIAIHRHFYGELIDAISHFVEPVTTNKEEEGDG